MVMQKTNKPASDQEKVQIRDLVMKGNSVAEIHAQFPGVDGRVISGIFQRIKQNLPAPGTTLNTPPSSPGVTAAPSPGLNTIKPAVVEEVRRTGFTPENRMSTSQEGFRPEWQEYFVVKKLDPPGEGIKGTEYPPFEIKNLIDRYPPGDYQIQHYRDGKIWQNYRDKVAPRNYVPGSTGIHPEGPRSVSPVDEALKLANVIHNAGSETRKSEAEAKSLEATAKIEEVRGKAQVEASAQVALMQIVKDAIAGKDSSNPVVTELLGALKANSADSKRSLETELEIMRTRSKLELEEIRERAKSDREAERDRAKEDRDRLREELASREKIQHEFSAKMAEIEAERSRLNEQWREKMLTETENMRKGVSEELEERRKMNDEMMKMQRANTEEYLKMRKEMGAGANDIKVAEIIERGITTSLDRIGARIDMFVQAEKGNAPKPVTKTPPAETQREEIKTVEARVVEKGESEPEAEPEREPEVQEEGRVITDEDIEAEFERPWFKEWKVQVVATLRKRATGLKLHGSLMGEVFLNAYNAGKVSAAQLQWILSRTWKAKSKGDPMGMLDFARRSITDEEMRLLDTEDGERWFGEFVWMLAEIWNETLKRTQAERGKRPPPGMEEKGGAAPAST